ncbi:MAG: MarR family transcriptional regulator [Planctomycetota bacterium]|nr:MAG: MarR family transcriptional regulator [Planctomycetota bacterium]
MSERLERRVLQACNAVGTLNEYWGFKSIMGRVWTLLVLRRRPTAQSEVAELLGVSKSLVSSTMTELVGYGLVRQVSEHRNAPYEAVLDIWPVVTDVLRTREWMLLETTRLALESTREELRDQPDSPYDLERLEMLLSMVCAIQGLLRLVLSIRMPGSARALADWIKSVTELIGNLRKLP